MSLVSHLLRSFARSKIYHYGPKEAVQELRQYIKNPIKESFNVVLRLGIDTSIGEHMIRGRCFLPAGTGKRKKIAVFIPENQKERALKLGAVLAGDNLLKEIKDGKFNFDQVLATSDMIDTLKPLARILGPKGLMPNARNGTLVHSDDLEKEMKKIKKGLLTYKVNKASIMQVAVGKCKLNDNKLLKNIRTFLDSVNEDKPKHLKGKFIKKAFLSTTYSKALPLDLEKIDSNHYKYELPKL